ncbi:MAG TPA: HAD-IIIC family phosphatase, partial [Rhodospirillales bacterium]|nr:HAD-IIIC family phosphatase [Rhodospirillales bacterium]
ECAAPACYGSCGLYDRRADGRCRRFAYGIYRDRRYASPRGYGADISFGRWGKLKANGNTRMEPVASVLRRERLLRLASPLLRALGQTALRFGRPNLWADPSRFLDKHARRLHRRQPRPGEPGRARPDAFLIEAVNPDDEPVALELEMRVALDLVDAGAAAGAPPPFRCALRFSPGHSRHIVPQAAFAAVTGSGLPFKLSLTPVGSTPRLVFLALDFVTWSERASVDHPRAAELPAVKCVVFDLDQTLWHGVLVEGGGSRLIEGTERTLRELDRRGILLAAASKNDSAPALERLRHFGIADLFVATRIGWGPKSRAIAEIAAQLNLGLDAFAFVDDSAFERAEVAAALPAVACFDARLLPSLCDDPRLRGSGSAVARSRRRLYQEAERRQASRLEFTGDDNAFLRSCRTRLEIAPYRPRDVERVVELAQRTNQLNASGRKYDRGACAAMLADRALRPLVLRCTDVHGDYGMVGFAAVRKVQAAHGRQIRVEEFMLSCRVQGRRLEQAFFRHLAMPSHGEKPASLWIRFHRTPRNGALSAVLDALGFAPGHDGLLLSLPAASLEGDLVQVEAATDAAPATEAERQAVA